MNTPIIGAINGPASEWDLPTRFITIFASRRIGRGWGSSSCAADWRSSSAALAPAALVGLANAMDLAVTGRLVDGQEAHRIGLVSRVVTPRTDAGGARVGDGIATQCSPLGVGHAKRLVYDHLFTDLTTALMDEDETAMLMTQSEDFKEGIKAFTGEARTAIPGSKRIAGRAILLDSLE